jgi:hypothetical protein
MAMQQRCRIAGILMHRYSIAIIAELTRSDEGIVYATVCSHHLRRPFVKLGPTAKYIDWNALDVIAMLSPARLRQFLHSSALLLHA